MSASSRGSTTAGWSGPRLRPPRPTVWTTLDRSDRSARTGDAAARPLSRPRIWLLAARPKTLAAAAAPVLIGVGLAAHHGVASALPAVGALVGALLIQIATNLANDYYDFVRST